MANETIALLGLGTMGAGMAANLLKAGHSVTLYNRTRAKAEAFTSQGARVANTPAEAALGARIVIAMLADDAASRDAWSGKDGALESVEKGTILVEASTLSPAWVIELSALAAAKGAELIDAPVTGSRAQAEGAQLNFFAGGREETIAAVTPTLLAMGKDVQHLGPVGSGAKLKLINNFLCGVQIASLAEGLTWLERSGLDREKALNLLKSGAPGSPLLANISARMASHDYGVNFLLTLMTKDLQYAQDAAAEVGVDLTTAANARARFEDAIAKGYGEQDMSSVVEPVRDSRYKQATKETA
jgi:3-hydroxyisobutyrate dehydrogenase